MSDKYRNLRSPLSRRAFVGLTGAVTLGIVLAGCSTGASSTSSADGPLKPGGKVSGTIHILDDNTNSSFTKGLISDFEKQTGVKVKYEQANFNDLHDRLATMFSAQDSSYDVVMTWAAWSAEFGKAGWLQPLAKSAVPKDVLPAALDAVSYDGTVYGLPKFASAQTLFWNKTLFAKAGLDPNSPPTTWAEFVSDAKKLTGNGVYGFAADMGNTDGAYQNFLRTLLLNGGTMYDSKGAPAFNSAKGVDALTKLSDLLNTEKVMNPSTLQITNSSDLNTLFANSKVGMVFNWPSQYAAAVTNGTLKADQVGNTILPGISVRSASIDGSEGFAINKYSKNKAAALAWLRFVTKAKAQTQIVEQEGWLPVTTTLLNSSSIEAAQPVVSAYKEESKYKIKRFGSPYYNDVTQVLSAAISNVMLKKDTPKHALDGAAKKAQAIIDRYNK